MKTCSKCGGEFPATTEYWHRNKGTRDGLRVYCRPCTRDALNKSSRKLVTDPATGEVITAGALAKRKLVADPTTGMLVKVGTLSSRKLVTDPATGAVVTTSALSSRLSRRTTEGLAKSRAANTVLRQKRYENGKWQEYMDNNPLAKLRLQLSNLINSSMRARHWSKTTKTQMLVGCSFEFLMQHLQASLPDYEKHKAIHIDHILPCKCAENADELNALQHYSNLQWLPGAENLSKSDSLPPDWQERKAKLMAIYWSSQSVTN